MNYIATNIRLPSKTLESLKMKAVKEHKSLAQLIREAIEKTYQLGSTDKTANPKKDPLYHLIGSCASGIADGSTHHDRDIYAA